MHMNMNIALLNTHIGIVTMTCITTTAMEMSSGPFSDGTPMPIGTTQYVTAMNIVPIFIIVIIEHLFSSPGLGSLKPRRVWESS